MSAEFARKGEHWPVFWIGSELEKCKDEPRRPRARNRRPTAVKLTPAQKTERHLREIALQRMRDYVTATEQGGDGVLMARAHMAIAAKDWVRAERQATAASVSTIPTRQPPSASGEQ
jgi:hypothetical protein